MYEKAKFVSLYLMRPQKMKFESVQINMKHVLYSLFLHVFVFRGSHGRMASMPNASPS